MTLTLYHSGHFHLLREVTKASLLNHLNNYIHLHAIW